MLKPVKEIVYVFMKGKGWVPTIVREDVRDQAKKVNFGWSGGWSDITVTTHVAPWPIRR